ncbi:TetR/AcrR family transcriptional regulator [Falsirhodobacter halotolerans]|uniref:TetR/AcrR family transcriptional regulator n=1 Tax=Falsirhodobacter halotolerans TaxID=1146892 RepID=UPI001FD4189B|nr:TetR/AcrR family transcriptional regulator [Falsirhodobacter halotolerans]MCJ8140859.1 TetR/AcrR family transcriptional regulator [Falsirhodobacter halotolerans]
MGRTRSVDRDNLLDVAEDIVRTQGAAALTIDALAKAVGITKGGVQYTFPSKAALIDAICVRWMESYEALFARMVKPDPEPIDLVRAHVGATFCDEDPSLAKAASLMIGMLQSPEFMAATRAWYGARLRNLDPSTEEGRRARLAFLAAEGAFCLRYLGLMHMDDGDWTSIFADIQSTLLGDDTPEKTGRG